MLFKRKSAFFLDLSDVKAGGQASGDSGAAPGQTAATEPAAAAVLEEQPSAGDSAAVSVDSTVVSGDSAVVGADAPMTAASTTAAMTTAEAIAAELRADQEAKPAVTLATFAPDCLNPANAVPTRRRRAGANLAMFKEMAGSMFKA